VPGPVDERPAFSAGDGGGQADSDVHAIPPQACFTGLSDKTGSN
jgi:hypothetical protein